MVRLLLLTRTQVLVIAYNVRYFPRPPWPFVRVLAYIVRGLGVGVRVVTRRQQIAAAPLPLGAHDRTRARSRARTRARALAPALALARLVVGAPSSSSASAAARLASAAAPWAAAMIAASAAPHARSSSTHLRYFEGRKRGGYGTNVRARSSFVGEGGGAVVRKQEGRKANDRVRGPSAAHRAGSAGTGP